MKSEHWYAAVLVVLLGLGSSVGAGCHRDSRPTSPNIVLVVMDTVRADHLSAYGYSRPTTPVLEAFAEESIRFEQAYSVSSWTLPSHASLFTGVHPLVHQANQRHWRLDDQFETLAELLRENGYSTAAFSENPWVGNRTGLSQGFEVMEDVWRRDDRDDEEVLPKETNRLVANWLSGRDRSKPFFLFVNFMEAHYPYAPPAKHRDRFVPPDANPTDLAAAKIRFTKWYLNGRSIGARAAALRSDLYDAEVACVDAAVGELMSTLRARDAFDNSLIVVTADHGENLGDRGHVDHVFSLYNDTLHVPLFIRLPYGLAGGTRRVDPVQLTDVFATLARAGRIHPRDAAREGVDLLTTTTSAERPIVAEYDDPKQAIDAFPPEDRRAPALDEFRRDLRSIQIGRRKLIWASDGRHELYDLDDAYHERTDIAALAPDVVAQFESQLSAVVQARQPVRSAPAVKVSADAATRERLRSLGYTD